MRTGSYPLMNLAEDYGVDYGDLLLWADLMRRSRQRDVEHVERFRLVGEAVTRVYDKLGLLKAQGLMCRLAAHADVRWGKGPEVWVGM